MANFDYTREGGVWQDLAGLTAADLADLDEKTVKAPNFAEGGSYAPTSTVVIGGAGMQFDAPTTFNDDITINGNVNVIADDFGVDGRIGVTGLATLAGGVFVENSAEFADDVQIQDDLTVQGKASFTSTDPDAMVVAGGVQVGGSAIVNGASLETSAQTTLVARGNNNLVGFTTVGNSWSDGQHYLTEVLVCADYGRVVGNNDLGPDSNATYSPATVQWINVGVGAVTHAVTYTVATENLRDGDRIGFSNHSQWGIDIADPSATILQQLYANHWVVIERIKGALAVIMFGSFNKHTVED